ncbi:MAG TPA: 2Fe-2S iron-sulfur cluster-binding protein, partial [Acetobacteraceae bacterium]
MPAPDDPCMLSGMRLTHPSIRPVGRSVIIYFDGSAIAALEGETIGAALSAAGILAFRRTQTAAQRGLHCGMGACFDCIVTVDGRIGQRACMIQVAEGMRVTGELPATPAAAPAYGEPREQACDVLVVGAGPAGLSAAIAAAEGGASVILLDERLTPG